jgi:ABC-type branched-subunit amino acid transport system ATPase component
MMLEVLSLTSGYGQLMVLHDVSLSIGDREAVAIVGANGAGKTTLVRTICGLLRARSGRVIKNGVEISQVPAHELVDHRIAVVLENRRLFGELTVRENLVLAQRRSRDARKVFDWADIYALFPMIEERLNTPVNLLSGGQQQMVAEGRQGHPARYKATAWTRHGTAAGRTKRWYRRRHHRPRLRAGTRADRARNRDRPVGSFLAG